MMKWFVLIFLLLALILMEGITILNYAYMKKELEQSPVEKIILKCNYKARYKEDFENSTGHIFFRYNDMSWKCEIPLKLYIQIEKGESFEAEFYLYSHEEENEPKILYVLKSVNGEYIPLGYYQSYIEL